MKGDKYCIATALCLSSYNQLLGLLFFVVEIISVIETIPAVEKVCH
ncbi:hypothetical protein XSR1_20111 [Xenorhabdus szentirmaii DSM 16338]|uniref:Uncharacterized protein n=1 Tax=Xenorhabdus szentirmaii DSM 16338 TaxID=1427518 RepID=W1IUV8_9GAMM|nr:hypothetical protein XSR1_20111 [Xenorhabdus szentirmaii DSM 16338]